MLYAWSIRDEFEKQASSCILREGSLNTSAGADLCLSKYAPNICPVIKQENLKNSAISGKRKASQADDKFERQTSHISHLTSHIMLQWRRSYVGLSFRLCKNFKIKHLFHVDYLKIQRFAQPGSQHFSNYLFNFFPLTFKDRFRRGKNPLHVMCSELIGEKR